MKTWRGVASGSGSQGVQGRNISGGCRAGQPQSIQIEMSVCSAAAVWPRVAVNGSIPSVLDSVRQTRRLSSEQDAKTDLESSRRLPPRLFAVRTWGRVSQRADMHS